MKSSVPVILFVYKRPELTKKTIESLRANHFSESTDLIVYADGPRSEKDELKVREVRSYLKEITGFRSVNVIESNTNKGLADSVIEGVSKELNTHESIIVLEDDMITSPYFLQYMNEALKKYEKEERVVSIHGYVYPVKEELPETFFLRGADCWGWATWRNGWKVFNKDAGYLLAEIKKQRLEYEFDFLGTRNNLRMLENQLNGKIDSWAIRWHASAFLENKLTLYPGKSLVRNIGQGADATHSRRISRYDVELYNQEINIKDIPIEENINSRRIIRDYFISIDPNMLNRLSKKIRHLFR
jgi:hypothetical protein